MTQANPDMVQYMPWGPWDTLDGFLGWLERTRRDPGYLLWAVLDLTSGAEKLAGLIALINTDRSNLSTEVGCVMMGGEFRRTHVTTNAVGLLLQWSFEELKLRRVQWQANALNLPSINTALKMGFRHEGIIRWQRVLLPYKAGERVERDGKVEDPGRHSAMLSIGWDEWFAENADESVREKVRNRMQRTS